jgi:hypothetical protein
MIDAYKIGVSILVDTNSPQMLGEMIRNFGQLDRAVASASAAVKELNAQLRETGKLATNLGQAASSVDGISRGMSGAARDAANYASSMERAARAMVPAPRLLGYDGGGSGGGSPPLLSGPRRLLLPPPGGGGGLAAGGGGGSGGGGGIPLGGLPGAPGGGGGGGSIIGGVVEYTALKRAMSEEEALTSALMSLGYKPGSVEWDAAYKRLRGLAGSSAEGTIFSEASTASFMPTAAGVSMFHGNTPSERAAAMQKFESIFPTLLRFGETAQLSHLGNADDATASGFAFAHMLNRYDPAELTPALDLLFNLSRMTHSTVSEEQKALKYGIPAAKASGMSPENAAIMTGFVQLMGFRGATAGTGVSNVINSIHNYTPNRNGDFSAAANALMDMGVLDKDGNVVAGVAPGGKLDFNALIKRIAAYAKSQRPIDAMKGLRDAFNQRGERVAGTFEDPEAVGRLATFDTDLRTLPGVGETQKTLAGTTGQQGQQVMARLADVLNTLVVETLPGLRTGFDVLHESISRVNSQLQGSDTGAEAAGYGLLGLSVSGLFKAVSKIAGQSGMKIIPASATAAIEGAAAVIAPVAITAMAFALASYLKAQLSTISDKVEGAIFGQGRAADAAAVRSFSPFDSSTWADPTSHWWNASPKLPSKQGAPVPVYLTNPDHVADHITNGISGAVNAPPTGGTGFDTRLGVMQPGWTP